MDMGLVLALGGAAASAALAGVGSAWGVSVAGKAASGVIAEKPHLFGKILVLQALPGTQGIYGFLVAILVLVKIGFLGGTPATVSVYEGWALFAACVPTAVVGLVSGIAQGNTAASAIMMTGKNPELSVNGITMTALVETYAILALLCSILMYNAVTFAG